MAVCKLCEVNEPRPNGLCEQCMDTLGVIEMPPARRKAMPCRCCGGNRFVRVIPRSHTVRPHMESNRPEVAPMTLTQAPVVHDKLLGRGKNVAPPSIVLGDGMLETYTCLACGYVEWFVEDPSEIPIGPEFMSELVESSSDAYR